MRKSEYLAARLTSDLNKDLYERDKHSVGSPGHQRAIVAAVAQCCGASQDESRHCAAETVRARTDGKGNRGAAGRAGNQPCAGRTSGRPCPDASSTARSISARRSDGTIWRPSCSRSRISIGSGSNLPSAPPTFRWSRRGQTVSVAAHGLAYRAVGKIVFISPMLDRETHSARVVAEIANPRRQLAAGLPGPLHGRDRGALRAAHRAGQRDPDRRQGPGRIRAHGGGIRKARRHAGTRRRPHQRGPRPAFAPAKRLRSPIRSRSRPNSSRTLAED